MTLARNGVKLFPVPEIIGGIFGYFGYQDKEDHQRAWSTRLFSVIVGLKSNIWRMLFWESLQVGKGINSTLNFWSLLWP